MTVRSRCFRWGFPDVHRFSCLIPLGDDLAMQHRAQLHHALAEREGVVPRADFVLTEENRPVGPVDPNQPVRGPLNVAQHGFRELVGEDVVIVVCPSIQPSVIWGDLIVAVGTHRGFRDGPGVPHPSRDGEKPHR